MSCQTKRNPALWKRRGPAHRVIEAFGGVRKLARAIDVNPATITLWLHPRPKGSGGLIPSAQVMRILAAAEIAGIELTDAMLAPRFEEPAALEEVLL